MNKTNHIYHAFEVLLKSGELGTTDARNINSLIPALDDNGSITKEEVIGLLFSQSKNSDGAYRNFLSRIKAAIVQAMETAAGQEGKEAIVATLNGIKINIGNESKSSPARVQFFAGKPKVENVAVPSVQYNRAYDPEKYIPNTVSSQIREPLENAVKVFISYASNDKFIVDAFIEQFTGYCQEQGSTEDTPIIHWSMNDLLVGDNFDSIIKASLQDSDYGLALLSEAFFDSRYITEVELEYLLANSKILPVGLIRKINGKGASTKKFFQHIAKKYSGPKINKLFATQIFYLKDRKGDFYEDCDRDSQAHFIQELYGQIQENIKRAKITLVKNKVELCKPDVMAVPPKDIKQRYDREEFIPTIGETKKIEAELHREVKRQQGNANEHKVRQVEALQDMFDWLKDEKSSLYALLGDYGMGKTFTCRMFALQLIERGKDDPALPKPIYMDLRDVPTFVKVEDVTRQPTLEEMLHTVLRLSGMEQQYTASEVLAAAHQGKLLLIFDGLDEKLVYYTKDMRHRFLQELLRAFPQHQSKVKIVISCRTHHFETISEMNAFLLGLGRSGVRGEDYRALSLLPFSASQILRLLTKLLGAADANRIFSFIDNEQYLKDLAQRPFMLKQLAGALPTLQALKNRGLPINAASFYEALITENMNRDEGKHIIKARHKRELLMELAAAFWQKSTQTWKIDELNDWFCNWLHSNETLAKQYRGEESAVLEKDLRNSTLLVLSNEQDFGFSHSSMQEYFLSKWLLRRWQAAGEFTLEQPISSLTKRFMLDHLVLLSAEERKKLHAGLAKTLASPFSPASELALEIVTEMADQGIVVPEFTTIDLRGARLANARIKGLKGETLFLDKAECHGSRWYDCHFTTLEIDQGNMSESLWRESSWENFNTHQTSPDFLARMTLAESNGIPGEQQSLMPGLHRFPTHPPFPHDSMEMKLYLDDWQLAGHFAPITSCCFSPAGDRILSASYDNTLKLWDLHGKCLLTFQGHDGLVWSCCFSPKGDRILSASEDNTLKLWDLHGKCLQTFQGHIDDVGSCCFSPDGQRIFSFSADNTFRLWDLQGKCLQTFQEHDDYFFSCCFSPAGDRILSASSDNTLKLWDLHGKCLLTFQGHDSYVRSCCFSPQGDRILSASDDKTLKLWDLHGNCLHTFQGHDNSVWSCCFSPQGDRILSASYDNTLKLWDLHGNCLHTFQGHDNSVLSCCFSPQGDHILSASDDKTLKLWDLHGNCLHTFQGHDFSVWSCCFSPQGDRILSASADHTLKLWDLHGNCLHTFQGHDNPVSSCCFSPQGDRILSASVDNTLKLWDLHGKCLHTFQGHDDAVWSCCFSPQGDHILSASADNTLKLWDLHGKCLHTFQGHDNSVRSCCFSPQGDRILSASADNTTRLWNLKDGTTACILASSREQWYSAIFNNNCLQKITGTELAWKMANLARDGKGWFLDELAYFSYHSAFPTS